MLKKDNKGIALITLVVAVLMMLIISSVIIYNTTSHIKIQSLNNMYNDIQILNEQVLLYYSKNNELPIVEDSYQFGKSDEEIGGILLGYQPTSFYVIDINKIDKNILSEYNSTALKYGKDYLNEAYKDNNNDDVYIININTHQIFYVRGIIVDNNTYYTIPGETEYERYDVAQTIANPPVLENELQPAKYGESNTLVGTNKYDKDWYDYSERSDLSRWARAQISDTEIYMWVPRFTYNPKTNEYAFLKGKTDTPIDGTKDITEEWRILGAFADEDGQKLSGIWLDVSDGINSINDVISKVYELAGKDNTSSTTTNTSITGKEYSYYNPVIPAGFRTVQTETASWRSNDGIHVNGWNEGLVIEDEDGNEFVWVPVDGTNVTFNRLSTNKGSTVPNYCINDEEAMPFSTAEETEMINKYQGFYIARYEAGKPSSGNKPLVKQNQEVWTNIDYTDSYTNAKLLCNRTYVKSGLVTGIMWDTTITWINTMDSNLSADSRSWGNHNDSILPADILDDISKQNTGFSDNWKKKNIYDLAGNVYEWTAEYPSSTSSYRVFRGGDAYDSGLDYPADCRRVSKTTHIDNKIGFRIALYIK